MSASSECGRLHHLTLAPAGHRLAWAGKLDEEPHVFIEEIVAWGCYDGDAGLVRPFLYNWEFGALESWDCRAATYLLQPGQELTEEQRLGLLEEAEDRRQREAEHRPTRERREFVQ